MLSELFEIDVIDSNNFILNNEKKNAPILNIRQICFTALLFFALLIFCCNSTPSRDNYN